MISNVIFLKFCRLIGQPSDWASSQLFIHGSHDSIYRKLFKNNMDGLNSFYPSLDAGLDHVLNSDQKVAYFQNVLTLQNFVNSFKKTHCKVLTYLQGSTIYYQNNDTQ